MCRHHPRQPWLLRRSTVTGAHSAHTDTECIAVTGRKKLGIKRHTRTRIAIVAILLLQRRSYATYSAVMCRHCICAYSTRSKSCPRILANSQNLQMPATHCGDPHRLKARGCVTRRGAHRHRGVHTKLAYTEHVKGRAPPRHTHDSAPRPSDRGSYCDARQGHSRECHKAYIRQNLTVCWAPNAAHLHRQLLRRHPWPPFQLQCPRCSIAPSRRLVRGAVVLSAV
jgi:hypothetical protein